MSNSVFIDRSSLALVLVLTAPLLEICLDPFLARGLALPWLLLTLVTLTDLVIGMDEASELSSTIGISRRVLSVSFLLLTEAWSPPLLFLTG